MVDSSPCTMLKAYSGKMTRIQKKVYDYGDKNIIRSHFRPERWLFPFYVDHFAITQKTAKCPRIICIDKTYVTP